MSEPSSGALDFSEFIAHHLSDRRLWSWSAEWGFTKQMLWMMFAGLTAAAIVLTAAHSRGRLRTALDFYVLIIRHNIVEPFLRDDTDAYLNYFLTLFLFIFCMNLMGLVPSGMTPTGNISVTAALSLTTFLLIQGSGIWRHGFFKHFKNLVPHGVPWWMTPLIFLIEFMGYFTKCIALCIRLFANMTAGHLVILLFLGLILFFGQSNPWTGLVVAPVSVALTLGLYALELIVALIQAYVFTLLTAIFVGGALHPQH